MKKVIEKQQELINELKHQITSLSLMSKIELGDDVIDYIVKTEYEIDSLNSQNYIPFISEVEEFNEAMGKPNSYTPNIPGEDWQWKFVYDFILEELNEYKEACEKGDLIGVADALGDIMYVLCNGIMLHGMKDKIEDVYQEIQRSNMSKLCETEEIAKQTIIDREKTLGVPCHYEKINNHYVVYRTADRKVQKSINYSKPDLKQFFK
jgi:NTP pyrophosphatase (non-canonical NTP hydrolase)